MKKTLFKLHSPFNAAGDQPKAIEMLVKQRPGQSTLLGVTGSGKTFTMAHVIAQLNKPVLIMSPNKTLAAQLYEEFSLFFPESKVCYFVSYYDYYQPESYLPAQDIYIPKETKINDEIERLRVETTASLITRKDTIVIASVSCIYSLGNPIDYKNLSIPLNVGQKISREDIIKQLIFTQYKRNEVQRTSGTFQVTGNTIEVQLPYQKEKLRIELFGDKIEEISFVEKKNNNVVKAVKDFVILPAKHFVTTTEKKQAALKSIEAELENTLPKMENPLYRERLKTRTENDLEMLKEIGWCSGIENYSSHFDGRKKGQAPFCLLNFMGNDFLLIIDESHIAMPQLRGMYKGDQSRKQSLVNFGFRLPSAKDNRPLKFEEIESFFKDVVYVTATPGEYELIQSENIVEQIIRPTGLVDPTISIHSRKNQLKHLVEQIKATTEKGFRSLVMVMTKKMAEELARYLEDEKIKVCYLHCDLKTPQRTELLLKLRQGIFDCIVGVNLLREGIDLPEVAFVAIMDADLESFLRDKRSFIQIIGRAARNTESHVVLYADKRTKSMHNAIEETKRRRNIQLEHNKKHNITPQTVQRDVTKSITSLQANIAKASKLKQKIDASHSKQEAIARTIVLEKLMQEAAQSFDFEKAIELRDEYLALQKKHKI